MKRLGINGGWRALALACLNNAIKTSDIYCIYEEDVFSSLCELAGLNVNEVIVSIRFAELMKKKYGDKWYKRFENGKTTRNGSILFTES